MVPTDPIKLIAFFEQCQATNKSLEFLRRSPRIRSIQRKRKWLTSCRM
jgi:hypothetical protein